jgi:acetyltransferase-like isoleucine patch superfamily enzyme
VKVILNQITYSWRHHGRRVALGIAGFQLQRLVVGALFRLAPGPKITWGRGVTVRGRCRISGDGQVIFGDRCIIAATEGDSTELVVTNGATLTVGPGCYLNGPRIYVTDSVTIGANCLIGATISDSDFHGLRPEERDRPRSAPIIIDDDCWVAGDTMVFKGVHIGRGAVVGAGATVRTDVAAGSVVIGDPHVVVKTIDLDD